MSEDFDDLEEQISIAANHSAGLSARLAWVIERVAALEAAHAEHERDLAVVPEVRARRKYAEQEALIAEARSLAHSAPEAALAALAAMPPAKFPRVVREIGNDLVPIVLACTDPDLRQRLINAADSATTRHMIAAREMLAAGTLPRHVKISRAPSFGVRPESYGRKIALAPEQAALAEAAGLEVRLGQVKIGQPIQPKNLIVPPFRAPGTTHVTVQGWDLLLALDERVRAGHESGDLVVECCTEFEDLGRAIGVMQETGPFNELSAMLPGFNRALSHASIGAGAIPYTPNQE